jgi:hypothetical protein
VKLLVGVLEAVSRNEGIDLRCGDAAVTEHFLDHAEVGTMLEQVGGEAMP